MSWLITNIPKPTLPGEMTRRIEGEGFTLHSSRMPFIDGNTSVVCLLDGYVLNRLHVNRVITNEKHLVDLYFQYGEKFLDLFKGYFSVIVLKDNFFRIFSDHLGLKKFFYFNERDTFIFSSSVEGILHNVSASFDRKAVIQHCLFDRFTGRGLPYRYAGHNRPAMMVNYSGKLTFGTYWKYQDLTVRLSGKRDIGEIADYFRRILRGYLDALQPGRVSVPLTGDAGTRTLIAGLLAEERYPVTYAYGNPESRDVVSGRGAAERLYLEFRNPAFGGSAAGYRELVGEIRRNGNGIVSPHRAYRLYGMKQAADTTDVMFLGHLAKETVCGSVNDDPVVPRAVGEAMRGKRRLIDIVNDAFGRAYFRIEKSDTEYAKNELSYYNEGTPEERYSRYLFTVHAHLHAAQDCMVIDRYVTPVPVYLDLDYLIMLFSSQYNYLNAFGMHKTGRNRQRTNGYYSRMMHYLQPSMTDIPLGDNTLPKSYIRKRPSLGIGNVLKSALRRRKYKPAFSYRSWFADYIAAELNGNDAYTEYFDPQGIDIARLNPSTETDCLPFTRFAEIGYLTGLLD